MADEKLQIMHDVLTSDTSKNPLMSYSPIEAMNKSLLTSNKIPVKAINEVHNKISSVDIKFINLATEYTSLIGDHKTQPKLQEDVKKIGGNILSALIKIATELHGIDLVNPLLLPEELGSNIISALISLDGKLKELSVNGGISDLLDFTTNDLKESSNKLYVTRDEKNAITVLPAIIADQSTISTNISEITSKIPSTSSSINKLVDTEELTRRLSNINFMNLPEVDLASYGPNRYLSTDSTGNKIIFKAGISSTIQKVSDGSGNAYPDVEELKFVGLNGSKDGNTVVLSTKPVHSRDILDLPKVYDEGKILVSGTGDYRLESITDLTISRENVISSITLENWVFNEIHQKFAAIVEHRLLSYNLIVAFYDLDNIAIMDGSITYKLLDKNQILVLSPEKKAIKCVVNCSQGTAKEELEGITAANVLTSAFVDDKLPRLDKTYSSSKIEDKLAGYYPKVNTYNKAEADAKYSLKENEHFHPNRSLLNRFSYDEAKGDLYFSDKKILMDLKPKFYQKTWNNEESLSQVSIILDVLPIYNSLAATSISNSEIILQNIQPLLNIEENEKNKLYIKITDGLITVLEVELHPQETQKYILGISPNIKISVKGKYSGNFYLTGF